MNYLKPNMLEAKKRTKEKIQQINFQIDENFLTIGVGKKYFLVTFGCQGNEADSEVIAGILENIGYIKTFDETKADLIIVNSCAIRENAENRFWGTIGSYKILKQSNKELVIVVAGCMPQEESTVNNILKSYPQVNIILGTHNIHKLPDYLAKFYHKRKKVIEVFSTEGSIIEGFPQVRGSNKKAWVNIMFGCDEFCTYCIVPFTRGKERSRLPNEIINEVSNLVRIGYLEITLLGQNVNAYGKDFQDMQYTFGDLLSDLDKTKIPRIRFTTSHPRDLDEKTMYAMQLKSIMPHLHLPVQSGSNSVLKSMNRKYTKEEYMIKINKLRQLIPDISITTDIIVGFPNEKEEDFQDTISLVKEVMFEGAFTFIYSPRENTPAARFVDDISIEEKHRRLDVLHNEVNEGYLRGHQRFIGRTVNVLVDGVSKTDEFLLNGYSEHNKVVNFIGSKDRIGTITKVEIISVKTWYMMGKQVDK